MTFVLYQVAPRHPRATTRALPPHPLPTRPYYTTNRPPGPCIVGAGEDVDGGWGPCGNPVWGTGNPSVPTTSLLRICNVLTTIAHPPHPHPARPCYRRPPLAASWHTRGDGLSSPWSRSPYHGTQFHRQ